MDQEGGKGPVSQCLVVHLAVDSILSSRESFQETANTFHRIITKDDLSPSVHFSQGMVKVADHLFHLVEAFHKAPVEVVCDPCSTDCLENRL